jgi:pimeloyl-ACP methyl ester carboxylesterase
MGGYIALEFARRYRARLRGLVLMDTRAEPDTAEARKARESAMQVARERGAPAIATQMLSTLFAPGAADTMPQVVERVRLMMEAAPAKGIIGALAAMRDRVDSRPTLPQLDGLPTLVVVGEQDQTTPPSAARVIADGIPGAVLSVIPGAGHLPPVEQPLATTRVLTEFLQSLR